MIIEKTTTFKVDNTDVKVADLPAPLRKQFELFDAFRQELAHAAVKFEMANTAVTLKQIQLQDIIRQTMNPPKADESTKAQADNV